MTPQLAEITTFGVFPRRVHGQSVVDKVEVASTIYRAAPDRLGAEILVKDSRGSHYVHGAEHPDTLSAMNNLAQTRKTQGDLAGARQLEEQVLEASRRLLGVEHPSTSVSAWNLLQTLLGSGDANAAGKVRAADLMWLLERDPANLGASQRRIRQWLSETLSRSTGARVGRRTYDRVRKPKGGYQEP